MAYFHVSKCLAYHDDPTHDDTNYCLASWYIRRVSCEGAVAHGVRGCAGGTCIHQCKFVAYASPCIPQATSETLKKVRISGGGRCNVTHRPMPARDLTQYFPRGSKELVSGLTQFGSIEANPSPNSPALTLTTSSIPNRISLARTQTSRQQIGFRNAGSL